MTQRIDLNKTPEPSWLREVAHNSLLGTKDLMRMFNVSQATIYNKIDEGVFPPPDLNRLSYGDFLSSTKTLRHKSLWKVSTIRKFFKQGETRCR